VLVTARRDAARILDFIEEALDAITLVMRREL
jgi:hypothetical protein